MPYTVGVAHNRRTPSVGGGSVWVPWGDSPTGLGVTGNFGQIWPLLAAFGHVVPSLSLLSVLAIFGHLWPQMHTLSILVIFRPHLATLAVSGTGISA